MLLSGQCSALAAKRLVLKSLQLWRNKAFGILKGLATDVMDRCFFRLTFTDFDVIAVYPVISDLKCAEPGEFSFFGLQFDQISCRVLADGTELIQLVVVASFDDPALADHHRRIFNNGFV